MHQGHVRRGNNFFLSCNLLRIYGWKCIAGFFIWLSLIKLKYKLVPSRLSSPESWLFRRSELSGNFLNTIKKCDLRPLDFAQKCPQNTGNAISDNLISTITRGVCPLTPLEMCRQFGLTFLRRKISVGLPTLTEASTSLLSLTSQKPHFPSPKFIHKDLRDLLISSNL